MTATDNITISRAVVEQALETLSNERYVSRYSHIEDAITHLTTALEAAKGAEPVAWLMTPIDAPNEYPQLDWDTDGWSSKWRKLPLYTNPAPQIPEGWQLDHKFPLSRFINDANINASDSPHIVIQKLEAAMLAAAPKPEGK